MDRTLAYLTVAGVWFIASNTSSHESLLGSVCGLMFSLVGTGCAILAAVSARRNR